jgi:hypothetical protein
MNYNIQQLKKILKSLKHIIPQILVFMLVLVWIFSGWFKIWQNPRTSPKIQEAKAAAGDVILMWDGSSADIPAGWTCLNCVVGDPFYGVFPRASSSYATATSGADTVTHTLTFSTSTGPSNTGSSGETSGTLAPSNTHIHSWGVPTLSSSDIRPPFKNLLFIKANNPTSLPAGIIGMFDIASTSSLPAGWTSYNTLNASSTNIYLRGGENATSTGGATTHIHTTTATLTSGTTTGTINDTANTSASGPTLTHTHDIVAGSALPNDNNNPPFITIVFGKLSSASDIPDGLVAFFDNTSLPINWSQITTSTVSGESFLGRFLVGSSTAGTIGGVSTHNHGGTVTWTSTGPSATTLKVKSGTTVNLSGATHTHDVTYTVSSASSLPVYRDVILGKFTAPPPAPTFTQSAYRFFQNTNSTDVGTPLANQDTSATLTSSGQNFRLRSLIHIDTSNLSINGQNFKLQFAQRGADNSCDTSFSGETYSDVTNSTLIAFNDNSTPSDGAALTSNANDPSHLGHTTLTQTYEESNNFTNSQSAINAGNDGMWDFSLKDNGAPANTAYCFRIVKADDSLLDTYSVIPQIITAGGEPPPPPPSCSGGTFDPSTKKVTVGVRWAGSNDRFISTYLTRSKNNIFVQTDWTGGGGQLGPITSTNNKFDTSTPNIDFSTTTGSIKLRLGY